MTTYTDTSILVSPINMVELILTDATNSRVATIKLSIGEADSLAHALMNAIGKDTKSVFVDCTVAVIENE